MRLLKLLEAGISAIWMGILFALAPFINILLGWWLSPLLILSGLITILVSVFLGLSHVLKAVLRFFVCLVLRTKKQERPALHYPVLHSMVCWILGGKNCYAPLTSPIAERGI